MLALLATMSTAAATDLGVYEPTGYGWIAGSYDRFPTARTWEISALSTAVAMSATTVGLTAWRFSDPNLPVYPWLVTIPAMGVMTASLGSWIVNGQPFGIQAAGAVTWMIPATLGGFVAGAVPALILTSALPPEEDIYGVATGCVIASVAYSAIIAWGPTLASKSRWSARRRSARRY